MLMQEVRSKGLEILSCSHGKSPAVVGGGFERLGELNTLLCARLPRQRVMSEKSHFGFTP